MRDIPPVESLVDAMHDPIHPASGSLIRSQPVKGAGGVDRRREREGGRAMKSRSPRKPPIHELMFQSVTCDQRIDGRCVQVGEHPLETLTAAQCRRLANWLHRAAAWIDAGKEKEGGR